LLCFLQVSELESVFQLLRCEVERLFLQAPSVDLDALGLALNEAEGLIDEQGSIVQVRPAALCVCVCSPGLGVSLCGQACLTAGVQAAVGQMLGCS
jgi:hypothetical protein